jgi:uncharacterized membrane protein YfcA
VGATAQSATGFGVVLPLAPLLFALEEPATAVFTIVVVALAHNALVLATRHRRLAARPSDAALLVAAALPGVVLGALLVTHLSKATMQLVVGAAVLAAVALRIHDAGRAGALDAAPAGAGVGFLAGVLTTTVGLNGPPLVIWLRARRATVAEIRDTLAIVFLVLNLAAIPTLHTQGAAPRASPLAALAAGLLAGHVTGLRAGRRLRARTLERATVTLLLAAATASVTAGIAGLA